MRTVNAQVLLTGRELKIMRRSRQKKTKKLSRQSSNELNDFECKLFGDGVSMGGISPPFLADSLL